MPFCNGLRLEFGAENRGSFAMESGAKVRGTRQDNAGCCLFQTYVREIMAYSDPATDEPAL